jgi:hypothetical protein
MFPKVEALLESEGTVLVENNPELLTEAIVTISDFSKEMKKFIFQNPTEFIGESVEDTFKNIRVFSEVATAQYVAEVSNICGSIFCEQEALEEAAKAEETDKISEYL